MNKRNARCYSPEIKEKAKKLYAEGHSKKGIARILKLPGVAPDTTVGRWVKGIESPNWVKQIPIRNQKPILPKPCQGCSSIIPAGIDRRQKFCSRSCASTFNNKKYPKRKPENKHSCKVCGSRLSNKRNIRCRNCWTTFQADTAGELPIKDFFVKGASRAKFNHIRVWARKLLCRAKRPKECQVCGFKTYVEVCHLKPIADFPENAPMKEVNSLKNLIYLCPNHHALLDKGYLTLLPENVWELDLQE